MASLLFLSLQVLATFPSLSLGFGTSTTGFDNQAEHEKITKAALKCPADDDASGECFSPDSLDQLAGHLLTFGAVGNPDDPLLWGTTLEAHPAHCDMADFFDGPDYPQSRDVATGILLECVAHIHGRFGEAIDAAAGILDDDGYIIPDEAKIPLGTGCIFTSAVTSSNSKCSAILGFGRALHGAQDFYSHSNWADEANASEPISVANPPGLLNTALAPFLDYRFVGPPFIPYNLSTGCWTSPDLTPGVKECAGRVSHNSLNKDGGVINKDGSTGAPTEDKGPRALVGTNFDRAVHMAFEETKRQWRIFRDQIIEEHGEVNGARIICVLTRDKPLEDCNGRKIGLVVDSSGSNLVTDPGNLRISAAQQINDELVSAAEATNPNAKPDLVTVIDFDDSATVIYPLGDPDGADFSSIDSSGGTYIAGGISAAIDEITADTRYKTRGRSGIIVLTDGDDGSVAARMVQLARAKLLGIKVSQGFLAPIPIPVSKRDGSALQARQSTSSDILAAVLQTGGVFATIDSAEAQQAFVELVLSNGLTGSDDGSGMTSLAKGLGILGLVDENKTTSYYKYKAKAGEDITLDFEAKSTCLFNVSLMDVGHGLVAAEASFSSTDSLAYTVPADTALELSVTATPLGSELECVFSVQLAGIYVPPPVSSSTIISSTPVPSSSEPPLSTPSSSMYSNHSSAVSPIWSSRNGTLPPSESTPIVTSIITTLTTTCPVSAVQTDNGIAYTGTMTTASVVVITTVVTKACRECTVDIDIGGHQASPTASKKGAPTGGARNGGGHHHPGKPEGGSGGSHVAGTQAVAVVDEHGTYTVTVTPGAYGGSGGYGESGRGGSGGGGGIGGGNGGSGAGDDGVTSVGAVEPQATGVAVTPGGAGMPTGPKIFTASASSTRAGFVWMALLVSLSWVGVRM